MKSSGLESLPALTSIRAVAALAIVVFHFGGRVIPFSYLPGCIARGWAAVPFFFVLSGFIMAWSYFDQNVSYLEFQVKRLSRIAPLHWGLTLCAIILAITMNRHTPELALKAIANFLLLQGWCTETVYWFNVPAWSLTTEFSFYLIFPFALRFMKQNVTAFMIIAFAALVLGQTVHHWVPKINGDGMAHINPYNPAMFIGHFLTGMLAASYYRHYSIRKGLLRYQWAINLLTGLAFCYMPFEFLPPVFALLILSFAYNAPRLLRTGFCLFLGEISYGIYLLQAPVFNVVAKIWGLKSAQDAPAAMFYTALAALIILSACTHYFFERPVRKFLLRKYAQAISS